jgi:cobalt-zinc-cadmium efflux system outer membrane protein
MRLRQPPVRSLPVVCLLALSAAPASAQTPPAAPSDVPTVPVPSGETAAAPGEAPGGSDELPDGPGFTLAEALAAMEAGHPALTAARHRVEAADGQAVAAGLWDNPQLSVGYNRGVVHNGEDPVGEIDWSISQNLQLAGAPAAARRSAEYERDAVEADYDGLLAAMRLDVEGALVDLAAAIEQRKLAEAARARIEEAYRIVTDRVTAGAEPRYDAARVTLSLADARADDGEAVAAEVAARAAFDVAVGPNAAALRGAPQYALGEARTIPSLDELLQTLAQRPDVRAAQLRIRSADENVSAARRAVWPVPSLSLSGGYGASPGEVALGVGLNFDLPFVNYGQGAIDAAQAQAAVAEDTARELVVGAEQTLRGFFDVAAERRQAHESFLQATAAVDESMIREAEDAYRGGTIEVFDLIDAYTSYRDTRARAVDLAASARQAELDVLRAATVPGMLAGGSYG